MVDVDRLDAAVRAVEPGVALVPLWMMRGILAADCGSNGVSYHILRNHAHAVDRERLLTILEQDERPIGVEGMAGPDVLLLPKVEPEWLVVTPAGLALLRYWRLLFHARVYAALKRAAMGMTACELHERIDGIGRSAFNDACFVLQKERYLSPTADGREAYARFGAVFLEMDRFSPASLPAWFAAVEDAQRVRRTLAIDVDADEAYARTRLPGAAEPGVEMLADAEPATEASGHSEADERQRPWILSRAARAAAVGNAARAAILHVRGGRRAPGEAEQLIEPLAGRLRNALGLDPAAMAEWRACLGPVLVRAAEGWWNVEGRILYDLQKVCVDHEREIDAVDGLGWVLTLGRRPLRRPVPAQRLVLMCKHLQSAARRLTKARLAEDVRTRLRGLLREAIHAAEHRLRENLTPKIEESVRLGGLAPRNAVERIAESKLIGELLDQLIHRGFASMSDLRDTFSRNQLKLDDLHGARQFIDGDQLLQIDRHLGQALDGVYHPGEVYLRFFQRISSLLFAVAPGRWLTYHVIIPFGGAFLVLEGIDHSISVLVSKLMGTKVTADHPGTLLGVGFFFFALVNWPRFRAGLHAGMKAVGRGLRWVFSELPQRIMKWPVVRAIVESRAVRLIGQHVVKPLVPAAAAWVFLPARDGRMANVAVASAVFIATSLLLNSRVGRAIGQAIRRAMVVLWNRLTVEVLAAAVAAVMNFFRVVLESIERVLYAVDEWLRFRSGQGRASLAAKAALGAVWGIVTYFTRFAITLLVEPQINPIKHFPVVTVSHKMILPTVPLFASGMRGLGLATEQAYTIATTTVFLIPGIFGFLAWELKENWRLYRANRARGLRPVLVGSHGETLRRLLRPGFHSGTLPKIFARLRRADIREPGRRTETLARRQAEALEHVGEAIRHFIERDFIALLNQHPAWAGTPIELGEMTLAATRIRASLRCPALGEGARVSFEQWGGWIVARIDAPGWMAGLDEGRFNTLSWALLGLYKLADVDLVREQVEKLLGQRSAQLEVQKNELVVWTGGAAGEEIVYDLREELMRPQVRSGANGIDLPALEARQVVLRYIEVEWNAWVRVWESGDGVMIGPPQGVRVLPMERAERDERGALVSVEGVGRVESERCDDTEE